MPAPRLLVFDLDGTLIDSSLDLCNSVNAAMHHVGRPGLPNPLIASYIGDGAAMLVRRALGDPGDLDSGPAASRSPEVPDDETFRRAFDFFITFYRAHKLDNTVLYDGVLDSLRQIRNRHPHLPMAVLTNKPVLPSREICAALELAPFFFQIYGGNSFPTKKPDPAGLLAIIEESGGAGGRPGPSATAISPDQVVMIGDSAVDVLTARRCAARSLGCSFGLAPESLAAVQPDVLVAHARDWPAALGL